MLKNFFALNAPFTKYDEAALTQHFTTSSDLRSVLYEPPTWPFENTKLKEVTFCNVSLSKTKFERVTFTKCTFTDCLFIGCEFNDVEFHRCSFVNCNLYKAEFINCYIDPTTIVLDEAYKKTHANIGVGLFQRILDNSSDQHQPDFTRNADILFHQWKRAQLKHDARDGKITNRRAGWLRFKSYLYDKVAGYG
jgi:hypothetical protein